VPRKTGVAWAQFVPTMAQLEDPEVRGHAGKMMRLVLESGYADYLKENYANFRSRAEDLEQLASFAQQFHTLEEFLTQMALLTNLEAEAGQPVRKDDELLRLSTIHQAKGLEFSVVFVIMLCDGMFPAKRALEAPDGLEEERRLLYVAITRARNELYLAYPLIRSVAGGGDSRQLASRFLNDIPAELIEEWNLKGFHA
jgi:DNA helicase-2/ATP-dependent DNA helicase PcrA